MFSNYIFLKIMNFINDEKTIINFSHINKFSYYFFSKIESYNGLIKNIKIFLPKKKFI